MLRSGRGTFAKERIIDIAVGVERVKRVAVVIIQRQPESDALRQIRISKEIAPESDQVRVPLLDDLFRRIRFISTSRHDFPVENFPQSLRRYWLVALSHQHISFHARFDDVQIGEIELIELIRDVIE